MQGVGALRARHAAIKAGEGKMSLFEGELDQVEVGGPAGENDARRKKDEQC